MNTQTVHVSLAGGLGNQLFQITAGLAMTDGEVVVHDFIGNTRKNDNNQPEIQSFNLPKRVKFSSELRLSKFGVRLLNLMYRTSIKPKSFVGFLFHLTPFNLFKNAYFSRKIGESLQVIHANDIGYFDITNPKGNLFLVGYFQSAFWPTRADTFSEIQEISPSTLTKRKMVRESPTNKVLALHIRLGDYSNEPKIGLLQEDYYKRAIDLISESHQIDEVWLFSDEPYKAFEYIPEERLSISRIFPNLSATETLDAMRNADYFVISNSSFSWWGAFLARTNSPLVVAPSPWFASMESPCRIIPDTWIELDATFK